jgi:hypothetical protein
VVKKKRSRVVEKEEDLLQGVARAIGSTLGTIVAKVNPGSKRAGSRHRAGKKKASAISASPRRRRSKKRS